MRPLRFAPEGPFVGDPAGGGPVEQGAGTPGVIYRAELAADQAMTAAAVLLSWQRLSGGPVTQLPWTLPRNRFFEFAFELTMNQAVAAPGGNLVVEVTAEDLVTAVRTALFTQTVAVPPDQTTWPLIAYELVDGTSWANDRGLVEVSLTAAATTSTRATPSGLSCTQYVP